MSGATAVVCAACGAPALPADRFCERCGHEIRPATEPCRACGAPPDAFDADGYCTRCGVRERVPREPHEVDAGIAAGVSDPGHGRDENQDALHLEAVGTDVVAVVCDGISACAEPASAAQAAAAAAGAVLATALQDGDGDLVEATKDAVRAAQAAVAELPYEPAPGLEPPSCTYVSAVCRAGEVVVGSVGDSRAYWLSAPEPRLLTADDSWAEEQVASGALSRSDAHADMRAHAVTRWIGTDAPAGPPLVARLATADGGRLILCSDGLWNYAPDASDLSRLTDPGATPLAAARVLVEHALASGGRDNVTVAVIDTPPTGRVAT